MLRIGFIGVGIMGGPMARNLLKVGYEVIAFDVDAGALRRIVEDGARDGCSIRGVTESSDIVLTMLPNSPEVESAILGNAGVLESAKSGQIVIDMSSISPLVTKRVADALLEKGVEMLDAPVSGGQEKAEAGTLAFMVGGKQAVFEKCKGILGAMGASVTLVGDIGAGQTTKLVNQVIVAVNIAVVAEGLMLGKKAGVDPTRILDAIKGGLAGSQCLVDKAPRMLESRYAPGFRMRLHVKDLTNALETSRALHVAMPLTTSVMEMMQSLMAAGMAEKDHGALALFYEKINAMSLGM
jgi:2-hydroxy-3-oxopropionate reductase